MARSRRSFEDRLTRMEAKIEADRRNALGLVRQSSGAMDADQERAARLAADNLLQKALRRLDDGDDVGARRFVERSLTLELDDDRSVDPGAMGAHLLAWDVVRTHALEARDDDAAWLQRATAILDGLHDPVRIEWLGVLNALADDVDARTWARIMAVVGTGRPSERDPLEDVASLPDRVETVVGLLRAVLDFERG